MKLRFFSLIMCLSISINVYSQQIEEMDESKCEGEIQEKEFTSEVGEDDILKDIKNFIEGNLQDSAYFVSEVEKMTLTKDVLKEIQEEYETKKVITPAKYKTKKKWRGLYFQRKNDLVIRLNKKYSCKNKVIRIKRYSLKNGGWSKKNELITPAQYETIIKTRTKQVNAPEEYNKWFANLVYCKAKPEELFKEEVQEVESDVEFAYKEKNFVPCSGKLLADEKCVKSSKSGKVYVYKLGGGSSSGSGEKKSTKYKSTDGGATWQVIEEKIEKYSK